MLSRNYNKIDEDAIIIIINNMESKSDIIIAK